MIDRKLIVRKPPTKKTTYQKKNLPKKKKKKATHQGVSGTMFSFNYNGGSGLQLSNTDYSMFVSLS